MRQRGGFLLGPFTPARNQRVGVIVREELNQGESRWALKLGTCGLTP